MKKSRYLISIIVIAILSLFILGYINKQSIRNYTLLAFEKLNRYSGTSPIYYANSSYDRGPVVADLIIPRDEDLSLLDDVLKAVFQHGASSLSDEEKSIEILKYVSSSLKLKANGGSATKIIRDGFTLCGGMARVFVMLSRGVGLPARYGAAKYMPTFSEHVVAEVFYEGRWHLFDPTFGMFFYSNPSYDRNGYIISFHEFLSRPYDWTPFKVVPRPWKGRYDQEARAFSVTSVEDNYLEDKYRKPLITLYRKEMAEAFPVAFGSNDTISYPVDADLLTEDELWFGQEDSSYEDLILLSSKSSEKYRARFFGSHYLGEYATPAHHTWVIKAPPGSLVTIEYYCVEDKPPNLNVLPLRAIKIIGNRSEGKRATFTLLINDGEAILSVYCPEGTFFVDAMHASR